MAAVGALAQLVRWSRHHESAHFSLAAVTLLACLDVMGFLAGFSIGPLLILVASPVVIFLTLYVRTHRRPVALLAFATLSLAGGMWTVGFSVAGRILTISLAMGALVAILQIGRTWSARRCGPFAGWGITLCACLGGSALLLGSTPGGLWSIVPFPAAGLGLGLALVSRRHRPALWLVALANLLLGWGFLSA